MRRLILLLIAAALFPSFSHAVISVSQAASNQVGGVACPSPCSITITPGSATTAGRTLVLVAKAGGSSSATFTISDSATQTWTAASCGILRSGTDATQVYWVTNAASITTVTIAWSLGSGTATIAGTFYEIAGLATSSPEDGCVTSTATSTNTITSASLTTTNANDIVMFAVGLAASTTGGTCAAGWNPGVNYTIDTGGCNIAGRSAISRRIVSAIQSGVTTTMGENTTTTLMGIYVAFADTPRGGKPKNQFPRVVS